MTISIEEFQVKYGRLPTETDPDYLRELERERMISKFQILDLPLMAPGMCSNCGGTKTGDRKYIDFGLSLDYYGVVYLCTLCIIELVTLLKDQLSDILPVVETEVPSPISVDSTKEDIRKIQEVAKNMDDRIMKLREYLGGHSRSVNSDSTVTVNESDSNLLSDKPESEEKSDDSISTEPEHGTIEQTSVTRRPNVPNLTNLNKSASSRK